jgi:hypothetical protein
MSTLIEGIMKGGPSSGLLRHARTMIDKTYAIEGQFKGPLTKQIVAQVQGEKALEALLDACEEMSEVFREFLISNEEQ